MLTSARNRSVIVAAAVLAVVFSILSGAAAQEPLRWKFEVGEKLDYDMTQDMTLTMKGGPVPQGMTTNVEQEMDMTWEVEGVNDEGEAVIRQKINRVRMKMTGPMGLVEYDSDSEEPPTGMAAMLAPTFDAMTEGEFEITMTPRGEVKDVRIPDELLTALKNTPGGQAMGGMGAENFKKMLSQGAMVLPEKAPQEGESWTTTIDMNNPMAGKQTVETTYTYGGTKDIKGTKYAVFKPELKMNFEGNEQLQMKVKQQSSDGEVLFNVEEGRLSSSMLEQNVTMDVNVGGTSMEQKIEQTIAVEVSPAGEEEESEEVSIEQPGVDEATETATGEAEEGAAPEE